MMNLCDQGQAGVAGVPRADAVGSMGGQNTLGVGETALVGAVGQGALLAHGKAALLAHNAALVGAVRQAAQLAHQAALLAQQAALLAHQAARVGAGTQIALTGANGEEAACGAVVSHAVDDETSC